MTLQQQIECGERARLLLADDTIKDAREHIEAELWRLFKDTSPQDADALKHIKAMQYFHQKYFQFFERAVTDGRIAHINLESKKKTLRERVFG